jgi:acetolactate synthase-1/2/3 large subunit
MAQDRNITVAEAYLELLALRGIDTFFANPGTDFASLVEGFIQRREQGKDLPRPVTIPHEIPLTSMAQGAYLATGRPQVAMVHVNVGTANAMGAIMAAHRGRIPVIFSAGRTPITEEGHLASRTAHIHWAQESYDQAAMVREYVKWDYELRTPSQLESVVDRAITMAMTDPKGPVYLTLPREVLATAMADVTFQNRHRYDLPSFYPDPQKVADAADLLLKAECPIIITSSIGRAHEGVKAMVDLAEAGGIAVCLPTFQEYMNYPVDHPCHQGFGPNALLPQADVILVVDSPVPWIPKFQKPKSSAKIIQVGIDPFYSMFPTRSFPSDLTIQGESPRVLSEIAQCIMEHPEKDQGVIDERKRLLKEAHDAMVKNWQASALESSGDTPLDYQWVSYQVREKLTEDMVVVDEAIGCTVDRAPLLPGNYFGCPNAGYLGWCLGAALGIKLGRPDSTIIALVGDGSYMFGVPSASHFTSKVYKLPFLTVLFNNQSYHAVKRATLGLYPDGLAAQKNQFPMSSLEPTAHFEKICEAFGGYGERVESPGQVGPALERALFAVRHEKRQALLNMVCKKP